jgi:hypothetical protein
MFVRPPNGVRLASLNAPGRDRYAAGGILSVLVASYSPAINSRDRVIQPLRFPQIEL